MGIQHEFGSIPVSRLGVFVVLSDSNHSLYPAFVHFSKVISEYYLSGTSVILQAGSASHASASCSYFTTYLAAKSARHMD